MKYYNFKEFTIFHLRITIRKLQVDSPPAVVNVYITVVSEGTSNRSPGDLLEDAIAVESDDVGGIHVTVTWLRLAGPVIARSAGQFNISGPWVVTKRQEK